MNDMRAQHRTKYGHALQGSSARDCRHEVCLERRRNAVVSPPKGGTHPWSIAKARRPRVITRPYSDIT